MHLVRKKEKRKKKRKKALDVDFHVRIFLRYRYILDHQVYQNSKAT